MRDPLLPIKSLLLLAACALIGLGQPATALAQNGRAPEIVIDEPARTRGLKVKKRTPRLAIRGRVLDERGVQRFTIDGTAVTLAADGAFAHELRLDDGEHEIILVAEDTDGNRTERRILATVDSGTVEATTAGLDDAARASATEAAQSIGVRGRYIALVIGIDQYDGVWTPLENAVRDARAVATILQDAYGFDQVHTLYDQAASRSAIIQRMEWLGQNLTPEDNLLIYYAGHGQLSETFNRGYWVPADATTASTSDFIANAEIQTWLGGIPSKHTLLIVDACFAADVFRGLKISRRRPDGSADVYRELYSKRSRKAMTSGGVAPVFDSGGDGHSVFARQLLDALRGNEQPLITAGELFPTIQQSVASMTNMKQTPQYDLIESTSDAEGEFVFVRGGTNLPFAPFDPPPALKATLLLVAPANALVDVGGTETLELAADEQRAISLAPGTYPISAVVQDLGMWESTVTLVEGEQRAIFLQPTPTTPATEPTGTLILTSAPEAQLFVDGEARPQGTHTLPAGPHTVRFVHPTYGEAIFDVTVEADETRALPVHFERTLGVGTITAERTTPWASILIDGERQTFTTPRVLKLPPGTYEIAIERQGYDILSQPQTLVVRPGTEARAGRYVFEMRKQ